MTAMRLGRNLVALVSFALPGDKSKYGLRGFSKPRAHLESGVASTEISQPSHAHTYGKFQERISRADIGPPEKMGVALEIVDSLLDAERQIELLPDYLTSGFIVLSEWVCKRGDAGTEQRSKIVLAAGHLFCTFSLR